MYAIAGVTGNTGSVVANTLLEAGKKVRVIVRASAKGEAWRARGAEVVVASLEDTQALTRALEGVEGAYLLVPPNVTAADVLASGAEISRSIAKAVDAAKLPRLVLLSSIAAHRDAGTGPIVTVHYAEQQLADRPGVTFLRPCYFMENWAGMLPAVHSDRVLPSFIDTQRELEMVSTRDIGRVAAELLLETDAPPVVELSGPRSYTPQDVADSLSTLLGETINLAPAPVEAMAPVLASAGLGAHMISLYQEMTGVINAGDFQFEGGNISSVRGSVSLADALRPALALANQ